MGFLLGAFGKLNAGKQYRAIQSRLMKVQSKARRVQRDVEKMTKMIDAQEKQALNSLKFQQNVLSTACQNDLFGSIMGQLATGDPNYNQEYAKYSNQLQSAKMSIETSISIQQQEIQQRFDNMRDMLLEPLKDEEESLQTEKDSLESQLQLAKSDYEACKQMEQADAKMLAPNYTGGQG